jgi:LacI family transcriptional regulator
MRRSSAPTLHDVAREAGVSAMTVSVVINGTGSNTRVSDNTRSRILAAAERLRYRPNAYARGLSRRRMDTIGVVAVVDGFEVNVYFLELLNGVLEAATELGQNTIIFSVKGWNPESLNVTQLCDGRADGVIFIAPTLTQEFADALQARHLPFVTIHNGSKLPGVLNLDVSNESGAFEMVRFLISQGHRRILHLPGEMSVVGTEQRLAGYCRALSEAGLPVDESLIVRGHYSIASGIHRMREILSERTLNPLPTAIFCGSDAMCTGVCRGAHRARDPHTK